MQSHPVRFRPFMKWPTLLLICGTALVFNACQQHKVEAGKAGETKNNSAGGETKP